MRLLTYLIISLFALSISAQDHFMAFSFGIGIPGGDYASSKSIFNSGFAHNGFAAEYSGAYMLKRNIGIYGSMKFTSNLTGNSDIASELDKLKYEDAPANTEISYNISQWNLVSLKTGPVLTIPIGNLNIDGFFLLGLDVINQPDMEMIGDMGSEGMYTVSLRTDNSSFGIDAGLNLRYRIGESTGIRLYASYQQASVKGDIMQFINSPNGSSLGDYSCKIKLIHAGIGLLYYL